MRVQESRRIRWCDAWSKRGGVSSGVYAPSKSPCRPGAVRRTPLGVLFARRGPMAAGGGPSRTGRPQAGELVQSLLGSARAYLRGPRRLPGGAATRRLATAGELVTMLSVCVLEAPAAML